MIRVSNGNKKIGNDTLIINMNSATDCPSRAKELCKIPGKCYAMKAERCYKQVLPYRREQEEYWDSHTFAEIARDLIDVLKRKKNLINYIRVSESGDFKTQWDVNKLKALATRVPGVVFYGYTARRDLRFDSLPPNLILNGSGFMISNSFTAVEEVEEGYTTCSGDCRYCNLCKRDLGLDIKVLYH